MFSSKEKANDKSVTNEKWTELRGKIKTKFDKLTDENLDALKGSIDTLSAKLQSVYGYAKEKADSEVASFKASFEDLKEKVSAKVVQSFKSTDTKTKPAPITTV